MADKMREAQLGALQGLKESPLGDLARGIYDWGTSRRESLEAGKQKLEPFVGPVEPWFDRFKRELDELTGAEEGLPTSSREAQMRALKGTIGIGGGALEAADPADLATSRAARELAEKLGLGETGQSLAELVGGAASGLGAGDVGRAGVYATRLRPKWHMPWDKPPSTEELYKSGGRMRSTAAQALKTDPFYRKGTPAGDFMRKYVYQKEPHRGIEIVGRPPSPLTKGSIESIDPDTGLVLEIPRMEIPTGEYSPEAMALVMKHESGHRDILKLRETALETGDKELTEFLRDWKKASEKMPYRLEGSPIQAAIEETTRGLGGEVEKGLPYAEALKAGRASQRELDELTSTAELTLEEARKMFRGEKDWPSGYRKPHSEEEAMADLRAMYGDPELEEWIPQEVRDIMDPWFKRTTPKPRPMTPGQVRVMKETAMTEAQLRALSTR